MCVCDLPCLSGCPAAQDWAASHCLFASAATAADYCLLTLTHCGACRKVVPSNMSCILTTTAASLFSSQTPCRFHLPLPRCRSRSLPRKYSYLHTNFSPPFSPGDFRWARRTSASPTRRGPCCCTLRSFLLIFPLAGDLGDCRYSALTEQLGASAGRPASHFQHSCSRFQRPDLGFGNGGSLWSSRDGRVSVTAQFSCTLAAASTAAFLTPAGAARRHSRAPRLPRLSRGARRSHCFQHVATASPPGSPGLSGQSFGAFSSRSGPLAVGAAWSCGRRARTLHGRHLCGWTSTPPQVPPSCCPTGCSPAAPVAATSSFYLPPCPQGAPHDYCHRFARLGRCLRCSPSIAGRSRVRAFA